MRLLVLAMLVALAVADSPLSVVPQSQPVDGELECEICQAILKLAQDVVGGNRTLKDVEDIATAVCEVNHGGGGYTCTGTWQCKDVCSGAVDEFAPILLEIAADKYLDPLADCIRIGACKNSTVARRASAFRKAASAGSRSQPQKPAAPKAYLRIAQVTDIHHDPAYFTGGWTNCGEPLCCRSPDGYGPTPDQMAGYYGDYNCDTNLPLLLKTIESVAALSPDYVFLTGDDAPHNVWRQSQEFNTGVSINVSLHFGQAMPNTQMFPALGNHQGFPVNQYRQNVSLDKGWLYDPLADVYQKLNWLPQSALNTFRNGGFYTTTMRNNPNFRIIALNTNFHTSGNLWRVLNTGDIAGMIAFLNATLAQAARNNEFVYVLSHHPPLSTTDDFSNMFDAIYQNYSHIIKGVFLGHSHLDFYMTSRDAKSGEAVGVYYVPTSVTPDGNRNPGFRIYEIDPDTGDVVDYVQYKFDLKAQGLINNLNASAPANYEIAYRATTQYNLTSSSPAEWLALAQRMETDDNLFKQWYINYHSGFSNGTYTPKERRDLVCQCLSGSAATYDACPLPSV